MIEEEFLAFAQAKPLRKEFISSDGPQAFSGSRDAGRARLPGARLRAWITLTRLDDEIAKGGGALDPGRVRNAGRRPRHAAIVRMDGLGLEAMWADKPCIGRWFQATRAHSALGPTYISARC
jgi:hypothetical protein